jgi:hypothetical protein
LAARSRACFARRFVLSAKWIDVDTLGLLSGFVEALAGLSGCRASGAAAGTTAAFAASRKADGGRDAAEPPGDAAVAEPPGDSMPPRRDARWTLR